MKKTKIVATISDKNCTKKFIERLYKNGMNVVRLNTAHQRPEDALKVINIVRSVSDKIALLVDTKGPEIRTVSSDTLQVKKGDLVRIIGNPKGISKKGLLCVSYTYFARDVPRGALILIDDGDLSLRVQKKEKNALVCVVQNSGVIKGKKSVNVPGVSISLPSLTEKDKKFISFAVKHNVDFIAHSFVRNGKDVLAVKKLLRKRNIGVIAKIENKEGVDNIDEILDHAYGIMVARGDLGIEIPAEKLPGIQKSLVLKCIERKRPVIIATQMLHSMISNPRPTRAEVGDVATAIEEGADAVMLSGETAYGQYPAEAVAMMTTIALETEKHKKSGVHLPQVSLGSETVALLSKCAIYSSFEFPIKAIVADTLTGKTARYLASFRGQCPVFAYCYDQKIMRQLALSYGVCSFFRKPRKTVEAFVYNAVFPLVTKNLLKKQDVICIVAGSFSPTDGASFMEISSVKKILLRKH